MPKRLTADDYHALAKARGFEWVDIAIVNTGTPTLWSCANGHYFTSSYDNIKSGWGCRFCSRKAKKTSEDYCDLALEKGFIWLANEAVPVMEKTSWQCSEGHQWTASYNALSRGSSCPHCSNHIRKTTDDYLQLAHRTGLTWIGTEPPTTHDKTIWICPNGHEFSASYNQLPKTGKSSGCRICSGHSPKTDVDYHSLATEKGFVWIGGKPSNTHTKTQWQCKYGHTFSSTYSNVYSDHGCPHCQGRVNGNYVSSPQLKLHAIIGGDVNRRIGRYAVDIALTANGILIGIEYDCWYWHHKHEARDRQRDNFLIAEGWRMLHIKSAYAIPTREQLDAAIAELVNGATYVEIVLSDWGKT